MIQAKIYAPTFEDHREAVELTKPSRARGILKKTIIFAICMLIYLAWKSDFAFPIAFDWSALIVPLLVTAGIDLYYFFDTKHEAKNNLEIEQLDNRQLGPRHYRATSKGVEWWWSNHHAVDEWLGFDRYRLTEDLLIVASSRSRGYWVLPRGELSPDLTASILESLRQAGAKEVAGRRLSPPLNQPT